MMRGSLWPSGKFTLAEVPFGLSIDTNSHKTTKTTVKKSPSRRGKNGITKYGRNMVESAATILEESIGKQNLSFITCTLPSLEPAELIELTNLWSELSRQFLQRLRRLMESKGLNPDNYVYCTEIQEKRYLNRGEIAPHFHILIQGKFPNGHWLIHYDELAYEWEQSLSHFLGRPVDCSSATRIERIRKSAANYLGKYMSKGGPIIDLIKENGYADILPLSWWGASLCLKRQVKRRVKRIGSQFYESLEKLAELNLLHYRKFLISINGESDDEILVVKGYLTDKEGMRVVAASLSIDDCFLDEDSI